MSASVVARRILVRGMVQGVGYRDWARREARRLHLNGWVRNLADGRVELWVEGDAAAVDALAKACLEGPRLAEVQAVDVETRSAAGHPSFERRPTADRPET